MKVFVDQDLCISCGLCISICEDVFSWNEDDRRKPSMMNSGGFGEDVEKQWRAAPLKQFNIGTSTAKPTLGNIPGVGYSYIIRLNHLM